MDKIALINKAAGLAPWLLLTTLTALPASADPDADTALTVAYATQTDAVSETQTDSLEAATIRLNAALRAQMHADLDARLNDNLQSLLAASERSGGED